SWRGISGSWRSTRGPEQHVASATVGEAPAVSVVLATYNGERFLEPLLESLARQTIPPRELVVGDDGSTDRTVEIVSTFGDRAPFPVSVTSNRRRLGFSDNFLTLAGAASDALGRRNAPVGWTPFPADPEDGDSWSSPYRPLAPESRVGHRRTTVA